MYTFKQNMRKEVCVAWWPEATIQRCKLRAAPQTERVRHASDILTRLKKINFIVNQCVIANRTRALSVSRCKRHATKSNQE